MNITLAVEKEFRVLVIPDDTTALESANLSKILTLLLGVILGKGNPDKVWEEIKRVKLERFFPVKE
jgi:hypothetical protein